MNKTAAAATPVAMPAIEAFFNCPGAEALGSTVADADDVELVVEAADMDDEELLVVVRRVEGIVEGWKEEAGLETEETEMIMVDEREGMKDTDVAVDAELVLCAEDDTRVEAGIELGRLFESDADAEFVGIDAEASAVSVPAISRVTV